ncbi:MAG: N-6 DNA methylase, partial [Candidatus Gottesmanbacteria bacterium]
FIDKSQANRNVMLLDASKLGKTIKENDVSKTILQSEELNKICNVFSSKEDVPEFSKCVPISKIKETDYMIKAGLYFEIDNVSLTDNKKDINFEKKVFIQKKMGLLSVLSDKLFRNLLIDRVVSSKLSKSDDWIEQKPLAILLDKALGGDWGNETSNEKFTESVKCIRGTDIPNIRTCNYEDIPTRYVKKESIVSKSLRANDIVIEISGGSPIQSTGRVCLITEQTIKDLGMPIFCTNFCRVLRFKDKNTAIYIYHYLMLLYDHGQMFNLENNTSGIKNLIFSAFTNNVFIPIPKDPSIIQDICTDIEKDTKLLLESELQ